MRRKWFQRILFPIVAGSLTVVITGCGVAPKTAPAAATTPDHAVDPFCSMSTEGMSEEKRAAFKLECDTRAKDIANEVATRPPKQIVDLTPLPELPSSTEAGRLYGIHDDLAADHDVGKENYIKSWWLGMDMTAWAGVSRSDATQGMVFLFTRPHVGQGVRSLVGSYSSSGKDGALRFTQEQDGVLTLAAENGATYEFDIKARSLVKR